MAIAAESSPCWPRSPNFLNHGRETRHPHHPRRLGHQSRRPGHGHTRRQRDPARADAVPRTALSGLSVGAAQRERARCRPARGADGQQRSRPSQSRRRAHRLPGPHAHQQGDRGRGTQDQRDSAECVWRGARPTAASAWTHLRRRRALASGPPRRVDESREGGGCGRYLHPRDHRWAGHVTDRRREISRGGLRGHRGHRRDDCHHHRPLLCDGSGQALGAHQAGVGCNRAGPRRGVRSHPGRGGSVAICRRRDRRISQADHPFAPRRTAGP